MATPTPVDDLVRDVFDPFGVTHRGTAVFLYDKPHVSSVLSEANLAHGGSGCRGCRKAADYNERLAISK